MFFEYVVELRPNHLFTSCFYKRAELEIQSIIYNSFPLTSFTIHQTLDTSALEAVSLYQPSLPLPLQSRSA
jgi:hypothetical protein